MINFKDLLREKGFEVKVTPESTRTAQEAAEAIGCTVAEIAKSIIFRTEDNYAVLVVASGANRINEKLVENYLGKSLSKAYAEFVKEKTGFVIGGVPPFGHKEKLTTLVDKDLMKFENIWAAAGDQHSVFKLKPEALKKLSDGEIISIKN